MMRKTQPARQMMVEEGKATFVDGGLHRDLCLLDSRAGTRNKSHERGLKKQQGIELNMFLCKPQLSFGCIRMGVVYCLGPF